MSCPKCGEPCDHHWIGVDFDQTLRRDDGSPVEAMIARVRAWLAKGIQVRIVTARLAYPANGANALWLVREWCDEYIGTVLPVQWGKSAGMIELWDDKVVTVEADTGRRLSPSMMENDDE
jgi:hypothetical protein